MHTRFLAVALALLCPLASSLFAAAIDPEELDLALAELEARYHVQIHYQYDPSTFFPQAWTSPSMDLAAKQIHWKDAEALAPALGQFLAAHPATVIQGNLEHIYLLGRLSFQGRNYGGTHTSKSIYVVWDRSRKYTLPFILERLHSEFSSTLRDHHTFPIDRWMQVNPPNFHYTGTGFEMLGNDHIYESTDLGWADGFLVKYSESSIENDFNMISAWLFTKPDVLETIALQSARMHRKIMLAEEFYMSLSDQYAFR
jgi:hypothetical protein